MTESSIKERVKEAAQKKAEQQKENENPRKNLPYVYSPQGYMLLMWGFLLDLAGLVCAGLILFFGIGIIASFIVDTLGMVTIGTYMYFKTKHMPTTERWVRLAKRFGPTSLAELVPVFGDIMFSWTLYLWLELRK